jgi:hypothetical protein
MKPPPIRDQSESSQISQSQGFFSKLLKLSSISAALPLALGSSSSRCQHDMSLRIPLTLHFRSPDAQVPPQWP